MEETDENGVKRKEDGTFDVGTIGGPGRPADTPETIMEKKALKEIVKEYKEALADILPEITPVIKKKALEGDMVAIKEIHDRVMDKSRQNVGLDGGADGTAILFSNIYNVDTPQETRGNSEVKSSL